MCAFTSSRWRDRTLLLRVNAFTNCSLVRFCGILHISSRCSACGRLHTKRQPKKSHSQRRTRTIATFRPSPWAISWNLFRCTIVCARKHVSKNIHPLAMRCFPARVVASRRGRRLRINECISGDRWDARSLKNIYATACGNCIVVHAKNDDVRAQWSAQERETPPQNKNKRYWTQIPKLENDRYAHATKDLMLLFDRVVIRLYI